MHDIQKISPCLWFDDQAEQAATFYTSVFEDSRIGNVTRYPDAGQDIHGKPGGSVMTIEFELAGYNFIGLNGGPQFTFTPAISFFVVCETEAEVDALWEKLSEGGGALMELGKYDWSEKYGWVGDKYGLTWQIALGKIEDVGQKITPSLLFVGKQHGKAEEAINLYTSIFKDSMVDGILRYEAGEGEPEGTVKHAQFSLSNEKFMVMDSALAHSFTFNEAISLHVGCESQEQVDYFWEKLTADGGKAGQCGWLKDKYGVSWQVDPTVLAEMLADSDEARAQKVMTAMLKMSRIDIEELERAQNTA